MTQKGNSRRWPGVLIRIAVTGAVVAVLLATSDLSSLWNHIVVADLGLFAVGVTIWTASTVFMAWRWRYMLAVDGVNAPYTSLLLIYLESHFFGVFLPSAVGGDVFRGVRVHRLIGGIGRATVNLLADRMIGVWAVCLHGGLSLTIGGAEHGRAVVALAIVLAMVVSASFMVVSLAGQRLVQWLLGLIRMAKLQKVHRDISTQVRGYFHRRGLVAKLLSISVCQQLLSITVAYLCGVAAGAQLGFSFYMLAMPVVWVLSMLPAIGGIGPREAALVALMTGAGVDKEVALAAAALLLAAQLGRGAFGGVLYLVRAAMGSNQGISTAE